MANGAPALTAEVNPLITTFSRLFTARTACRAGGLAEPERSRQQPELVVGGVEMARHHPGHQRPAPEIDDAIIGVDHHRVPFTHRRDPPVLDHHRHPGLREMFTVEHGGSPEHDASHSRSYPPTVRTGSDPSQSAAALRMAPKNPPNSTVSISSEQVPPWVSVSK